MGQVTTIVPFCVTIGFGFWTSCRNALGSRLEMFCVTLSAALSGSCCPLMFLAADLGWHLLCDSVGVLCWCSWCHTRCELCDCVQLFCLVFRGGQAYVMSILPRKVYSYLVISCQ